MAKPRLPTSMTDAWDCGFLLSPARPVRAIDGQAGLVLAGGEQIYMLRPGAERILMRDPPDPGDILLVAAENRSPWRFAIATEERVTLFFKNKTEDAIVRLAATESGASATHIVWARNGTASSLYVRWDDGAIVRTRPDMSGVDELELEGFDALASDAMGRLGLLTLNDGSCLLYRTDDGEHLTYEQLELPVEEDADVRFAIAGDAAAVAVDGGGVFVTRAREAPLVACEALAGAHAIAFGGHASDAPLFGAIRSATHAAIVRVDAKGDAVRVAEFESDGDLVPEITMLSWDGTRKTLWGASPEMGIVACTAPGTKPGKKPVLS